MKHRFLILFVMALAALGPAVVSAQAQGGRGIANSRMRPDFSPGEYFVGFRAGVSHENIAAIRRLGAQLKSRFPGVKAVAIKGASNAVAQAIARNPRVAYVERVPMRYTLGLEDEQLVPALNNGLYGLITTRATETHSRGITGAGINVGVADTGVDYNHPDIAPNYRGGIDTIWGDNDPIFEFAFDEDWNEWVTETHGTHVAGTILAANNTRGVLGAAYSANLYHARVLDMWGGTVETVMAGVRWLVEEANCKVVNLSLGGAAPSTTEQLFFEEMRSKGALIVCAAGNDGGAALIYPAGYPTNIAVGAVDANNAHASWSNTGTGLDISAPGVSVLSSVPDTWGMIESYVRTTQTFSSISFWGASTTQGITGIIVDCGRGFAGQFPPAVAGNIALIQRGDATFVDKVTNAMNAGATAVVMYNNAPGNFEGVLEGTLPYWIPSVSVSDTDGAILLGQAGSSTTVRAWPIAWDIYSGTSMAAPHVTGALALAWSANPSLSNTAVENCLFTTARDLGAVGYDTTFGRGLVDAYAAVVAAEGGIPPPPAAPTNLTATASNAQVSLSWSASASADYYNVQRATVPGGPYLIVGQVVGTGFTDTGLTNGVTYYYVVAAVSLGGVSPNSSEVSATPTAPPPLAAPTKLTATAAKAKVTLKWIQSVSSGVTQNRIYRSTTTGSGYTLRATITAGTSFIDTSVTSGVTYYYRVTAVRSSGQESAYSSQASAKPR